MVPLKLRKIQKRWFPFSWRDLFVTCGILLCAVEFCQLLRIAHTQDGFASPIFVLAVLLISRLTNGYLFGLAAALLGVIFVNFIFTYPYWAFNFTMAGYPLTTLTFLTVSLITSALTSQIKESEKLRLENEKEKMRANLLRSVSHDIRTPLTSIMGSTSAVLENPGLSEEERRTLLEDARDEAQWLIRVVENLLSVTRIGNDRAQITKIPEAVEEILPEVAQKFRRRFPAVKIILSIPENLLMVPMDAILITQVLSNLLENAVLHGGTTTQIKLLVEAEPEWARFVVQDNGQGIPPELLPDLFSGALHHNEGDTGDGKRNMGLGLAVCAAIVRAHGGTLDACNLPQGGAEFSFRLPLDKGGSIQ